MTKLPRNIWVKIILLATLTIGFLSTKNERNRDNTAHPTVKPLKVCSVCFKLKFSNDSIDGAKQKHEFKMTKPWSL